MEEKEHTRKLKNKGQHIGGEAQELGEEKKCMLTKCKLTLMEHFFYRRKSKYSTVKSTVTLHFHFQLQPQLLQHCNPSPCNTATLLQAGLKVSCQWERRDLLHGACLANGSSDIPSTSAVSPLVMAAPMHAGHVIMFLAIGDGDTFISPLLPATPLQKQTPSVNTFRRDPVW